MTKNKKIIGLVGLPNSGKTTFFNSLTGLHQHTGNWPGVTVEKKIGFIENEEIEIEIIDLPGISSLNATSIDEKITRDFLLKREAELYCIIVDALNLERGLYLISQILELELPFILILNMMDKTEEAGISIDINLLEKLINVPIFPCVATKGIGIEEIKGALFSISVNISQKKSFYGEDFEILIKKVEEYLLKNFKELPFNSRFFALKLLEEDSFFWEFLEKKEISKPLRKLLEKEIFIFCSRFKYSDLAELITEKRYGFAEGILTEVLKDYSIKAKIHLSNQLDVLLTHKILGIPIFFGILYLLFSAIYYLGNPLGEIINKTFIFFGDKIKFLFLNLNLPNFFSSFLSDGILNGVGTVLTFLPNIVLLFFFISLLEDWGYFTRVSFLFDKLMHSIGLHGKAIMPMILGFGCNVPAIMGTRIMENERDRLLTILIIPFMSCSARLPIYVLFAGIFFPEKENLIILSLYTIGLFLAFFSSIIFQRFLIKQPLSHLIMELPPYHFPSIKGALIHSWIRAKLFLKKASTVIFLGVIIVWLLSSLPIGVEYGSPESYAGKIGSLLKIVLKPLGFGFYQAAMALLFGIVAKEVVVGTLGVLFSPQTLKEALPNYFTPLSAYSFMLISLIYIPCLSTMAMIRKEAGKKYMLISIIYTILLGWIVSFLFYQGGTLISKISH